MYLIDRDKIVSTVEETGIVDGLHEDDTHIAA